MEWRVIGSHGNTSSGTPPHYTHLCTQSVEEGGEGDW